MQGTLNASNIIYKKALPKTNISEKSNQKVLNVYLNTHELFTLKITKANCSMRTYYQKPQYVKNTIAVDICTIYEIRYGR